MIRLARQRCESGVYPNEYTNNIRLVIKRKSRRNGRNLFKVVKNMLYDWKTAFKADPTEWLLEDENPSVRYFTLKDVLDKSEDDAEVQAAKQQIMQTGTVLKILDKQQKPEYLQTYSRFYTYKYKGLVWSLLFLAELGAEPNTQNKLKNSANIY